MNNTNRILDMHSRIKVLHESAKEYKLEWNGDNEDQNEIDALVTTTIVQDHALTIALRLISILQEDVAEQANKINELTTSVVNRELDRME